MPFMVIRGTFHVVGKRGTKPSGMQPEGDSIQFKPKKVSRLFRRLADYFAEGNSGLGGFTAWMDDKGQNDSVWTLPEWNKTHFDNVVKVAAGKVSQTKSPNDLVFVSE